MTSLRFRTCIAAATLAGGAVLGYVQAASAASDGTLYAAYGTRPTLHCKPLYLSDLVLEAGERITTLALGDSARWRLGKGFSGAHGEVEHVFIKPTEFATDTNLEILTDRRVYNVILVNDARSYTPRIAFYQPHEVRQASAFVSAIPVPRVRRLVPPETFTRDYATAGPITVSHDTRRTYVSVGGDLRRQAIFFSSDLAGMHRVSVIRSGNTYVVAGVASELSLWSGSVERAYAVRAVTDVATATPVFVAPASHSRGRFHATRIIPAVAPRAQPQAAPAYDHIPAPSTTQLDLGG